MTTILQELGNNWHDESAYMQLLDTIVPNSANKKKLESLLIELYVDENNEYRVFRSKDTTTIYDDEIDLCRTKIKEQEEALEKEDKYFRTLLTKFQQMDSLKSSMASSQQKLIELNDSLQILHKKSRCYLQYQRATREYLFTLRGLVKEYIQSKNLETLIKHMDTAVEVYIRMMQRSVPRESCLSNDGELCETHFLPLDRWLRKCKVSP